MDNEKEQVRSHYDAVASRYGEQYREDTIETLSEYPANHFRLKILQTRLAELGARSVYEVGVGEGTPLVTISKQDIDVAGCDLSNEMVKMARRNFAAAGLDENLIQWADIEDTSSLAPQVAKGPYDAVIAVGVLPHVGDENLFLTNIRTLMRPGGRCFIEFRNELFSLFTFNRYTKEFIHDSLLAEVSEDIRTAVVSDLDKRLALDEPAIRPAPGAGPSYDEIRARFHNPLTLPKLLDAAGLTLQMFHWYHFHPAPPMLEGIIGPSFRRAGFALEENPVSWRGYFLCSAGLVEVTRGS